MEKIAVLLMAVVGILLSVEIVNYSFKYKKMRMKKDMVSLVIISISFVLWLISMIIMIQRFYK
ncbi:TPA: hypothetical protein DCX16_05485 [bacterium]|nr:hypothetical protein [bacterium]